MDTIAEEKTTLSEGYTVSVTRMKTLRSSGGIAEFTQLTAYRGKIFETMRVDDVGPNNLRRYLDLAVREIERQRARISVKPVMLIKSPKTFEDFVKNMAFYDMFILSAFSDPNYNQETGHTTSGPAEKPKRKRKAKKLKKAATGNNDQPF